MAEINQSKLVNFCSDITKTCYPTLEDQRTAEQQLPKPTNMLESSFISKNQPVRPPHKLNVAAYHSLSIKELTARGVLITTGTTLAGCIIGGIAGLPEGGVGAIPGCGVGAAAGFKVGMGLSVVSVAGACGLSGPPSDQYQQVFGQKFVPFQATIKNNETIQVVSVVAVGYLDKPQQRAFVVGRTEDNKAIIQLWTFDSQGTPIPEDFHQECRSFGTDCSSDPKNLVLFSSWPNPSEATIENFGNDQWIKIIFTNGQTIFFEPEYLRVSILA